MWIHACISVVFKWEFTSGSKLLWRHDVRSHSLWSTQSWSVGDGVIAAHFKRFPDTNSERITQRNNFKTSLSCLKLYIYTSSTSTSALPTKCKLYCSLYFGETKDTKRGIFAINGIFNLSSAMLNPLLYYSFSVWLVLWSTQGLT